MPKCTPPAVDLECAAAQSKSVAWIDCLMGRRFLWFSTPLIKQTGGEIARECRAAAWEHVRVRAAGMSPAQATGYMRAVAPSFVVREADVVLRRRRVRVSLRGPIIEDAIEQLTALVSEDFRCVSARAPARVQKQAA